MINSSLKIYSFALVLLHSFISLAADLTQEQINKEAYAVYLENDSRSIGGPGSDQAYTNGFKFSYIYAQGKIPNWSKGAVDRSHILDQNVQSARVNFGLSIGQQIFTPSNTLSKSLISDDRPYAGWLYLGFAVSLKEQSVEHFLELDLGTVGPSALGQQTQNNFHQIIKTDSAEGWDNGLNNEPTLQLFYQKRYKVISRKNIDLIPYYGASLGNVHIGGHIGGVLRLGVELPDNFGPSRPSASDGNSFISSSRKGKEAKDSYYLFTGVRGDIHSRNIFLDGNTFQKSHNVRKYPFTFETEFGLGMHFESLAIIWSFVNRSPEFEQKNSYSSFASINMVYFP